VQTAVIVRIAVVVLGFALFVVAEVLDNVNARKPAATGAGQAETLFDDAKVFTPRIFGAIAIAGGLLAFVFANHTPIF
jgi:hypothetical protein